MLKVKHIVTAFAVLSLSQHLVAFAKDSAEAAFPAKPVKIIVPYGAGGAADILIRVVGEKLREIWGQPVIVENKPGGIGAIGITAAAKAAPDGYTLVSIPVSNLAVNMHLYRKLSYDISKDLAPVVQVGAVPNVLVVSSSSSIHTIKDLIALANDKPDNITYSSPGVGSQAHLAAEMFGRAANVKMLHVPYNGVAQAVGDVVGGQVHIMFAQLPSVMSFISNGRLRALGVASSERSKLVPEIPTIYEVSGMPKQEAVSWSGLMAPANTPLALREKIARDVTAALNSEDVIQKLRALGTEPLGGTPQQLETAIKKDSDRYGALIKKLNVSIE